MKKERRIVGYYDRFPDLAQARTVEWGRRLTGKQKRRLNTKPLVSVLTVCKEAEGTIEQTLLSVLNQTYTDIEYIIVDGASTDGTISVIEKYKNEIDYIISEKDHGLYDALNKALSLASGDFILILNADDWYEKTTVERLLTISNETGFAVVGALARYIAKDGSSYILRSMPFDHSIYFRMPLRHETLLIPRTIYQRAGGYRTNFKIIGDYDFAIRLYGLGISYFEIQEPLLNFRTNGISNTDVVRLNEEMRIRIGETFPELRNEELINITDRASCTGSTFIELAKTHKGNLKLQRAVLALLQDREKNDGEKWKWNQRELRELRELSLRPDITVIIPCLNSGKTIEDAINSVLSQSSQLRLEVLCIDDGSDDNTAQILAYYIQKDARIKLFTNKRQGGPGAARNRGVREAKAPYIFFLDADDIILPHGLISLYKNITQHQSQIVRGSFIRSRLGANETTDPMERWEKGAKPPPLLNISLKDYPSLLNSTEGHWACLYASNLLESIRYPTDIMVGEDSLFLVCVYAEAKKITLIPEPVYCYRENSESVMYRNTPKKYFDGLIWRRRAWYVLNERGFGEIADKLITNFWNERYWDSLEGAIGKNEMKLYASRLRSLLNLISTDWRNLVESELNLRRMERLLYTYDGE